MADVAKAQRRSYRVNSPGSFHHSLDQQHGGSVSINLTSGVRAGLLGI